MEIVRFAGLIYRSTKIPASHVALLSSIQVNDRVNAALLGCVRSELSMMRSPPRSRAAGYRAAISCYGPTRKRSVALQQTDVRPRVHADDAVIGSIRSLKPAIAIGRAFASS